MANNLDTEKKVLIVKLLAEDSSIRAIERITNVHRDTVMRLGVRVGEACAKIQDEKCGDLIVLKSKLMSYGVLSAKRRKTPAHSKIPLDNPKSFDDGLPIDLVHGL